MSMNITLSPQQERFIQELLANGKFQSAEAVISQALKLLEAQQQEYDAWVEDVRNKVDEATVELARGEGIPLDTVMSQLEEKYR
jgi:antitoxin ParD1/3/4